MTMNRFQVEISDDAMAALRSNAKASRRTHQDQAAVILEQVLLVPEAAVPASNGGSNEDRTGTGR